MVTNGCVLDCSFALFKDIDCTVFRSSQNTTAEDANILILGGEPLNEPIAAKGLFVMNTAEEVAQAERDYAEGRLGKHF